jgi:hypothetical protein
MIALVISLQDKVRKEFMLGPWEQHWYRHDHGNCRPCKRYFQLLDDCGVRMTSSDSSDAQK